MTTISGGLAELRAALIAADIRCPDSLGEGERPAAFTFAEGFAADDLILAGRLPWDYRVMVAGGAAWEDAATASDVASVTGAVLGVVLALEGWQLVGGEAPALTPIGGGLELTQDVRFRRHVDLGG